MEQMVAKPIPLSQIVRREDQPREVFDEEGLIELAESIREQGLQQPIKVRPLNGRYEIVMGERRWRAHQKLGAESILAFVEEMDDEKAYLLALTENLARRDLDPVETARAYSKLVDYGWSTERVGQAIGQPAFQVERVMEILGCRPDVLELIRRKQIPIEQPCVARVIARLSYNGQGRVLRAINDDRMTWDEVVLLANMIWNEENQAEMFAEVKLTQEQVESGRKVRSAIARAAQAMEELLSMKLDEDAAGAAIVHDSETLDLQIRYLIRGLKAMRRLVSRQKMRQLAEQGKLP